jgi:hypothetical protein
MVTVWYKNGKSVLDGGTRERDNARNVFEHSDIDDEQRR